MTKRKACFGAIALLVLVVLASCISPSLTPTPSPSPTPTTPTSPSTSTPIPTATPTPSLTPTPTLTPTPKPVNAPRPLGTVHQVFELKQCPSAFGDKCKRAVITCPGIADATVGVRITGAGTKGTVLLTTGGIGTGWYRFSEEDPQRVGTFSNPMMDALIDDGYKLVEIAWVRPGIWEGPGGSISLACRSATIIDWVHKNVHQGGLFVVQGNSGGSAQIAFALAYYGVDESVDLANLSGGPPPCPISTEGNLNFQEQPQCLVGAEHWDSSRQPMLFGNPRLHYPNTIVRFFLGDNEPSVYIINTARAYHAAITSEKSIQIVPNTGHGVHLTQEGAEALISSIRQAAGFYPK